jgi:membrane protease YdiL (CAAX protease family)
MMLRQNAGTLGRVLLFWIATMAILAMGSGVGHLAGNAAFVIGSFAVPVTFALTLLFVKWEGKMLSDFGLSISPRSWLRFGAGLSLGFVLIAAQTAIMWLAGGVRWVAISPPQPPLLPVLGYLLLATREELAFRGYPFRLLVFKFNPWVAQAIIAILFVVEHILGGATLINALVGAGIGSLVFGMAALVSRGLALPIGLHAAWNIGDWARGGKGSSGLWRIVVDPTAAGYADKIAIGSYAAVMLSALVGLWLFGRKSGAPSN